MLAIRMQRTGRKGHAQFRLIVQDAKLNPSSGRVVAALGNYDPHSKVVVLDKDKAVYYLEHGAQPSPRLVVLLKKEGVKMPGWVVTAEKMQKKTRHPDKLRRNRPKDAVVSEVKAEETPADTAPAEVTTVETVPADEVETETTPVETTELAVDSTEQTETPAETTESS